MDHAATGAPEADPATALGADARPLIAALLLVAGVVHLVMVPDHAGEWLAEGIGFAIVGWSQLACGVLVVIRCRRWVLWATVALNVASIAVWAWSRTSGLPIGPASGVAEPIGWIDLLTVTAEVLAAALAVVLLVVGATSGSATNIRRNVAVLGAVVAIGVTSVGLTAPSTRTHAHAGHDDTTAADGHAHDHTATSGSSDGDAAAVQLATDDAAHPHAHDDAGGAAPVAVAGVAQPDVHDHAATASAGATPDDLGFSLLMNGHQHTQDPLPMDAATTALLAHQLARTAELVASYPTVADAETAGYTRAGPFSPGLGAHYGKGIDTYVPGGVIDDATVLKPMLIYSGTDPDSRLVGFMYLGTAAGGGAPEGFAGPNDVWHYHTNTCLVIRPDGTTDAPLGADSEDVDPALCESLGGFLVENTGYMLHVWTVPGWENPLGVFHETHPGITCADGTYWTKPQDEIGASRSTCLDAP